MPTKGQLYGRRWRLARALFLGRNPYCAFHLLRGDHVRATVLDHIDPHKGDVVKFWDRSNWQSLCQPCHDSIKQSMEKGGRHALGFDGSSVDGRPIDPDHPWNR